jgi:hypothetical protein
MSATLSEYLKFNETLKLIRKLNIKNINIKNINTFSAHVNQCFSFSKGKGHFITDHRK